MRSNLIRVSTWNSCTHLHVCFCGDGYNWEVSLERLGFIHVQGIWERAFCLGQKVEEKCN